MKIELKNIKHMESLSEETNCYSATLHVNGKKIGTVSNAGHGGPDEFNGDQAAFAKAEAWLAANKPPVQLYGDATTPMDMELYCGELLTAHLISKDLKASLRCSVLFIKEGVEEISQIRWKGVRTITPIHIETVKSKYPQARILNEIPFDEALALFTKHG